MDFEERFGPGTPGPRVILVGVDGTENSMRAGAYAWGLARRGGAHLYIVRIHTLSGYTTAAPGAAAFAREAERKIGEQLREEITRAAEDVPVQYTYLERRGDPYAVLTDLADELRADMVVVGASSRRWQIAGRSLGTRLVCAGRWPVTVVP